MSDKRHSKDALQADQDLIDLLRLTLDTFEPPPAALIDRAIGLFSLYDFEAELLTLLSDSFNSALAVRSDGPSWRVLTFQSDGLRVELDLDSEGQRTLIGHLQSDVTAVVEVISSEVTYPVDVDEFGRFVLSPAPSGPFRVLAQCGAIRYITPVLTI